MQKIESSLAHFRREPMQDGADRKNPFTLHSRLEEAASRDEIQSVWRGVELPKEVTDLWSTCRAARLFVDVDYGQWGLVILDPASSAERTAREREKRPLDFRADDIVLGTILGDQELLVLAPSESEARHVMVALPIDRRADWFGAATSVADFLEAYFTAGGDKFWERAARH